MNIRCEHLPCGFAFGAAEVTRMCSDERKGWTIVLVETPRESLQIYVTKTGKVRIHSKGREWKPHEPEKSKAELDYMDSL